MNPDDRQDMVDRNRMRKQMALAAMLLTWVIVIAFLFGLTSDTIAARVEKVWPPFSVLFPSLMTYIGFYAHIGSKENQTLLSKETP